MIPQSRSLAAREAAVHRDASCILSEIVERIGSFRPMPDGRVLLEIELGEDLHERLALWGSALADLEPDPDLEHDTHPLMAPLPSVNVRATEAPGFVALQPVPPRLHALAAAVDRVSMTGAIPV